MSRFIPLELLQIPADAEQFLLEVMVDIPRPDDPDGKGDHCPLFGSPAASAKNRGYGTITVQEGDPPEIRMLAGN